MALPTCQIIVGDCRDVLKTLPDESVHCCVTSPPYFGLRDYGHDGQIGLEQTPDAFVAELVAVFREVHRVLRSDGTLWLNLGDSYATGGMGPGSGKQLTNRGTSVGGHMDKPRKAPLGFKPKDLLGIPWMVAFALRADGWYLRSDIIWAKKNCMPESVTDRPAKSHEYIFLLTKNQDYYYDHEAIKEPCSDDTHARYARGRSEDHKYTDGGPGGQTIAASMEHMVTPKATDPDLFGEEPRPPLQKVPNGWDTDPGAHTTIHREGRANGTRKHAPNGSGTKNNPSFDAAMAVMPGTRNKRTVWHVGTYGYSEAHFATFPPDLIRPCILAGCPLGGTCLDPFGGSGTTGEVALQEGRNAILLELNPEYAELARIRTNVTPGLGL